MSAAIVWVTVGASAVAAQQQGAVASLRVRTPDARTFDVALEELWIDAPDGATVAAVSSAPGVRAATRQGRFVVAQLDGPRTTADLVVLGHDLQLRSPRATAMLALYDRGAPHVAEHRALLTRRLVVWLDAGYDPRATIDSTSRYEAVPNVPRAFILEASDPLQAVALADAYAARPGVRAAYPLLLRSEFPR